MVPAAALDKPKRARLLLLVVEWVRALLDVNVAWVGFVERRHGPLGLGGDGDEGGLDGLGMGLDSGMGGGFGGLGTHGLGLGHGAKGARDDKPSGAAAPATGAPPPPPPPPLDREQRAAWAVAGTERGPLAPIDRILTSTGLAGAPRINRCARWPA